MDIEQKNRNMCLAHIFLFLNEYCSTPQQNHTEDENDCTSQEKEGQRKADDDQV